MEYFQLLSDLVLLVPFLFFFFNTGIVNYELRKLKFCLLSEKHHSLAVLILSPNSVFSHTITKDVIIRSLTDHLVSV